jgi:cell division protease FtsH
LGGRIAEEVVFDDISSGATGDIKQVTAMARSMVCDWGMSPLGPIAYGGNHDTVFLGRDIGRQESFSQETARLIDLEIRKIVDEQYQRATKVITENRDALMKIAEALLEFETIEGKHIMEIIEHGEIRSTVISSLPPLESDEPPKEPKKAEKSSPKSDLGGAGNPEPSPA